MSQNRRYTSVYRQARLGQGQAQAAESLLLPTSATHELDLAGDGRNLVC